MPHGKPIFTCRFFELVRVTVFDDFTCPPEATVRVKVGQNEMHEAAEGDGPVNALDKALRKALGRSFPQIAEVRLIDYNVHIINGDTGTESKVEVTVTSSDGENVWVTKGVSPDIIKASLIALAESLRKELQHKLA